MLKLLTSRDYIWYNAYNKLCDGVYISVFYEKQAEKYLHRQTDDVQIRIENAINKIPDGDIKQLKGYTSLYRLRVGDMRVIFRKEADNIYVLLIGSRGDIYKRK